MTAAISAGRKLFVALVSLLALAATGTLASAAPADPAGPAIAAPAAGDWTNSTLPAFSGSTADEVDPVTLRIYAGPSAEGEPVQTVHALLAPVAGLWALTPETPLPAGTYTALAEQAPAEGESSVGAPVSFTIDTTAPQVSMSSPGEEIADSTPTLHGSAGTAPGDRASISVAVREGASGGGPLVSQTVGSANEGSWQAELGKLPDGTYTAQAAQSDLAGNTGHSAPFTFTIDTAAPAPTITAPAYGTVVGQTLPLFKGTAGEAPGDGPAVQLDVYADGPGRTETLVESLPQLTVTGGLWTSGKLGSALPDGFYTAYVLQSDEAGNVGRSEPLTFAVKSRPDVRPEVPPSPAAAATVPAVTAAAPARGPLWLSPFPVVRIAGFETAAGARISLLTVQAPLGARVTVTCRGTGCPVRSEGVLAGAGAHPLATGVQVIAFRRFERGLKAGVTLEIRVSRAGLIGKYVRFTIRHRKLPTREDACLAATAGPPISCPAA